MIHPSNRLLSSFIDQSYMQNPRFVRITHNFSRFSQIIKNEHILIRSMSSLLQCNSVTCKRMSSTGVQLSNPRYMSLFSRLKESFQNLSVPTKRNTHHAQLYKEFQSYIEQNQTKEMIEIAKQLINENSDYKYRCSADLFLYFLHCDEPYFIYDFIHYIENQSYEIQSLYIEPLSYIVICYNDYEIAYNMLQKYINKFPINQNSTSSFNLSQLYIQLINNDYSKISTFFDSFFLPSTLNKLFLIQRKKEVLQIQQSSFQPSNSTRNDGMITHPTCEFSSLSSFSKLYEIYLWNCLLVEDYKTILQCYYLSKENIKYWTIPMYDCLCLSLSHTKKWNVLLSVLKHLKEEKLMLSTNTAISILNHCSDHSQIYCSYYLFSLFPFTKKMVHQSSELLYSYISCIGKIGDIQYLLSLYNQIQTKEIALNRECYSLLLKYFAIYDNMEESMKIYHIMKQNGYRMMPSDYSILIYSLYSHRLFDLHEPTSDEKTIHQMEVLIQDMIESNISKDISIYTLLFQFTKDQSTHPYLQSFLHLLQQSNYILDSNAYNYLLSFYTSKKNLSISWSILNVMNQNHYYPPWRLYSNILDLAIQYHDVNKITYLVESIEKQKIPLSFFVSISPNIFFKNIQKQQSKNHQNNKKNTNEEDESSSYSFFPLLIPDKPSTIQIDQECPTPELSSIVPSVKRTVDFSFPFFSNLYVNNNIQLCQNYVKQSSYNCLMQICQSFSLS